MKYFILSLRPKHWIKNCFIFLPLIFGGKLFYPPAALKSILAFILFSAASGVVYIINDISDMGKDKLHPLKRLRPVASGKISAKLAGMMASLLAVPAVLFSFLLDARLGWIIVIYLASNLLYSKILKEAFLINVICIGFFFLLRIIAGGVAADVELSPWIIIMSLLLALFLGFNKRYKESVQAGKKMILRPILALITPSILICYILYTLDTKTIHRAGTNHLIYSIPFVFYGVLRYLYIINKKNAGGDPTYILFADKRLQLNLLLWSAVCIGVIYFKL